MSIRTDAHRTLRGTTEDDETEEARGSADEGGRHFYGSGLTTGSS